MPDCVAYEYFAEPLYREGYSCESAARASGSARPWRFRDAIDLRAVSKNGTIDPSVMVARPELHHFGRTLLAHDGAIGLLLQPADEQVKIG